MQIKFDNAKTNEAVAHLTGEVKSNAKVAVKSTWKWLRTKAHNSAKRVTKAIEPLDK